MRTTASILAMAASVSATNFYNANPFKCPGNTDSKCTSAQSSGFDWSGSTIGKDIGYYQNFNFQNLKCGSSGNDKRSRFDRRGGSGKVAEGSCGQSGHATNPSFSCDSSISDFTIGHISIRPEFSCDLDIHYGMGDGSVCRQRHTCSSSGTTIANTQCAGAKNVTIVYPEQPSMPKPTCNVTISTVAFDCGTASTTVKPRTSTISLLSSTSKPAAVTTTTTTSAEQTKPAQESSSSAPSSSSQPQQTPTSSVSATKPAEETSSTKPVKADTTSATSELSTVSSSTVSSPAPSSTLPCPDVVPRCLNTFQFQVGCSDNTDRDCYCPDELFVKSVLDCFTAHGETDEVIAEAVYYFQGICAPYIPQNPAIVTCATYITTTATTTTTATVTASVSVTQPVKVTTVTVDLTTTVPCSTITISPSANGYSNGTAPAVSYSTVYTTTVVNTTITVPQVGFTSVPGGGGGIVPVASQPVVKTVPAAEQTQPAGETSPAGGKSAPAAGASQTAPAAYPSGAASGSAGFKPTGTPGVASGTGKVVATPTPSVVMTAGAAGLQAGVLGFAGVAGVVVAALL